MVSVTVLRSGSVGAGATGATELAATAGDVVVGPDDHLATSTTKRTVSVMPLATATRRLRPETANDDAVETNEGVPWIEPGSELTEGSGPRFGSTIFVLPSDAQPICCSMTSLIFVRSAEKAWLTSVATSRSSARRPV